MEYLVNEPLERSAMKVARYVLRGGRRSEGIYMIKNARAFLLFLESVILSIIYSEKFYPMVEKSGLDRLCDYFLVLVDRFVKSYYYL